MCACELIANWPRGLVSDGATYSKTPPNMTCCSRKTTVETKLHEPLRELIMTRKFLQENIANIDNSEQMKEEETSQVYVNHDKAVKNDN